MIYDIIGDLHGHADELRELLARLGYTERNGAYSADGRRAVFVGDFIDRGPKIRETLQIVRAMVNRDAAQAVIGNHEFNALCFHTSDGKGGFLRPHSDKNKHQHSETLRQLAEVYAEEWQSYLSWFKDLPIFLDVDGLRVVHAAWDEAAIRVVRGRSFHDPKFVLDAGTKGTSACVATEILLKGPEITLPEGVICRDKDGTERSEMRVSWWRSQSAARTYLDVAVPGAGGIPDLPIAEQLVSTLPSYGESDPPVVFGHYWLPPDAPRPLGDNAACVDFSVAKPGGFLAAYSWSGEKRLKRDRFTLVPRQSNTA